LAQGRDHGAHVRPHLEGRVSPQEWFLKIARQRMLAHEADELARISFPVERF
jgi:hypothetical protein